MDKTCSTCGATKPLDQFPKQEARCKPCQSAYRKAYYYRDPEKARAKSRAYHDANREAANARFSAYRREKYATDPTFRIKRNITTAALARALRLEVFTHYSGGTPECACCGERQDEFLTLDHTNGGGGEHRKQPGSRGTIGVFYWLRRNGFPDGYSVLCWNCHMAKDRRGGCPHEATRA